jgi:hypothetical protein
MGDVVLRMQGDIGVNLLSSEDDLGAFNVSFVSSDPRTAMRITERLASLFVEENLRDRVEQVESTSEVIDWQIAELRGQSLPMKPRSRHFERRAPAGPCRRPIFSPTRFSRSDSKRCSSAARNPGSPPTSRAARSPLVPAALASTSRARSRDLDWVWALSAFAGAEKQLHQRSTEEQQD